MAKKQKPSVITDDANAGRRTIAMNQQTFDKLPMGKELFGQDWDSAPYGENGWNESAGKCRGVASYVRVQKIDRGNPGIGRGK